MDTGREKKARRRERSDAKEGISEEGEDKNRWEKGVGGLLGEVRERRALRSTGVSYVSLRKLKGLDLRKGKKKREKKKKREEKTEKEGKYW